MEKIIPIKGNITYQITLDPSVWIFDDRKIDLDTYFLHEQEIEDEAEKYTKDISKHWDREIMEGAVFPPTLKTERKYEKQRMLEGTFGIPFKPFLLNAVPNENSTLVLITHQGGELELPIEEAYELIIGFSKAGKPLAEDGPIHLYYKDGSNRENPVKGVQSFTVI